MMDKITKIGIIIIIILSVYGFNTGNILEALLGTVVSVLYCIWEITDYIERKNHEKHKNKNRKSYPFI